MIGIKIIQTYINIWWKEIFCKNKKKNIKKTEEKQKKLILAFQYKQINKQTLFISNKGEHLLYRLLALFFNYNLKLIAFKKEYYLHCI